MISRAHAKQGSIFFTPPVIDEGTELTPALMITVIFNGLTLLAEDIKVCFGLLLYFIRSAQL